jgi:hypothetical protein
MQLSEKKQQEQKNETLRRLNSIFSLRPSATSAYEVRRPYRPPLLAAQSEKSCRAQELWFSHSLLPERTNDLWTLYDPSSRVWDTERRTKLVGEKSTSDGRRNPFRKYIRLWWI